LAEISIESIIPGINLSLFITEKVPDSGRIDKTIADYEDYSEDFDRSYFDEHDCMDGLVSGFEDLDLIDEDELC
jgi:hypothetical protein